jgi:hypothetical protein
MNDIFSKVWKSAILACFKALRINLCCGTEKKKINLIKDGRSTGEVSKPKFLEYEAGTVPPRC